MATPRKEVFVSLIGLQDNTMLHTANSKISLAVAKPEEPDDADLPTGSLDMSVDCIKGGEDSSSSQSSMAPSAGQIEPGVSVGTEGTESTGAEASAELSMTVKQEPLGDEQAYVSLSAWMPESEERVTRDQSSPGRRTTIQRKVASRRNGGRSGNSRRPETQVASPARGMSASRTPNVRHSARQEARAKRMSGVNTRAAVTTRTPQKSLTVSKSKTVPESRKPVNRGRTRKAPRPTKRRAANTADDDDSSQTVDDDLYVADSGAYTIKPGSTKKDSSKLVDSRGFSYILRSTYLDGQTVKMLWRCSVYNKTKYCPATVLQVGGVEFYHSKVGHTHGDQAKTFSTSTPVPSLSSESDGTGLEVEEVLDENTPTPSKRTRSKTPVPLSEESDGAGLEVEQALNQNTPSPRKKTRSKTSVPQTSRKTTVQQTKRQTPVQQTKKKTPVQLNTSASPNTSALTDVSNTQPEDGETESMDTGTQSQEDENSQEPSTSADSSQGRRCSRRHSKPVRFTDFLPTSETEEDIDEDDTTADKDYQADIGEDDGSSDNDNDNDNTVPYLEPEVDDVTYRVIPNGSQRKTDKLEDSKGYTYVVRYRRGDKVCWRCTKYGKKSKVKFCPAQVIQIGDTFTRTEKRHVHEVTQPRTSAKKPAVDNNDTGGEIDTDHDNNNANSTPGTKKTASERKNSWNKSGLFIFDDSITYEVQAGKTQRGGDRLMDSRGFYYVSRGIKSKDGRRLWRCPVYGAKNKLVKYCPASVTQDGDRFYRSKRDHIHEKPTLRPPGKKKKKRRLEGEGDPSSPKKSRLSEGLSLSVSGANLSDSDDNGSSLEDSQQAGEKTVGDENDSVTPDVGELMEADEVKYEVIKSGSMRGRDKLLDSRGYSYLHRHTAKTDGRIYWKCRGVGKNRYCPASVVQAEDKFYRSKAEHNHDANYSKILALASPESELYKIAEEYLRDHPPPETGSPQQKKSQSAQASEVPRLREEEYVDDPTGTYHIVKASSLRGQNKLYDIHGFSYNMRHRRADGSIHWRCTVRNKTYNYCPAAVVQHGNLFTPLPHDHVHPPKEGQQVVESVRQKLKEAVKKEPHKATSTIVTEVLQDFLQGNPCPSLPSLPRLHRMVHYHKTKYIGNTKAIVQVDPDDPRLQEYKLIGPRISMMCAQAVATVEEQHVTLETTDLEEQLIDEDLVF